MTAVTFGRPEDTLLAPNCVLLVEWRKRSFVAFDASGRHYRLGGISISWIWSHHQFEFEPVLFRARRPTGCVDLILCGFLFRSKRPADADTGHPAILPTGRGQFFGAGQVRRPNACPEFPEEQQPGPGRSKEERRSEEGRFREGRSKEERSEEERPDVLRDAELLDRGQ